MNNKLTAKEGIKESLPTGFGYLAISITFGIVGKSLGLSIPVLILISFLIIGGATQFTLIAMISCHSPIISILFSVFLINSRIILMGISLVPYFKKSSKFQNFLIGNLLTDESFALSINKLNYTDNKLSFAWINGVNITSFLGC